MADEARHAVKTAIAGLFGDSALESVVTETVALFQRLRREAERIHGQGETSSGRRAVLRGLSQRGPQTVPEMARARPVSRQYMQRLVNELTADGLVEAVANPAHKRSPLLRLTGAGEDKLEEMSVREQELFEGLRIKIPPEELLQAATTLRRVRQVLESPEWQSRIGAAEENER